MLIGAEERADKFVKSAVPLNKEERRGALSSQRAGRVLRDYTFDWVTSSVHVLLLNQSQDV